MSATPDLPPQLSQDGRRARRRIHARSAARPGAGSPRTPARQPQCQPHARRLAAYRSQRHGHDPDRQDRAGPGHRHGPVADRRRRARRGPQAHRGRARRHRADPERGPDRREPVGGAQRHGPALRVRRGARHPRLGRGGEARRAGGRPEGERRRRDRARRRERHVLGPRARYQLQARGDREGEAQGARRAQVGGQEHRSPRHPQEVHRRRRLRPGRAPAEDAVRPRGASSLAERPPCVGRRGGDTRPAGSRRGRSRRELPGRRRGARGAGHSCPRGAREERALGGGRVVAADRRRAVPAPDELAGAGRDGRGEDVADRGHTGEEARGAVHTTLPVPCLDRAVVRGRAVAGRQAHRLDPQPGPVPAAGGARQGVRHAAEGHSVHPRRGRGVLRPQRGGRRGARRGAAGAGDGRAAGQGAVDARGRVHVGAVRLGHGDEAGRQRRCPGQPRQLVARAVELSAQHAARRVGRRESVGGPAPGAGVPDRAPGGRPAADGGRRAQRDPALRHPQREGRQALHHRRAAAHVRAAHARAATRTCSRSSPSSTSSRPPRAPIRSTSVSVT